MLKRLTKQAYHSHMNNDIFRFEIEKTKITIKYHLRMVGPNFSL